MHFPSDDQTMLRLTALDQAIQLGTASYQEVLVRAQHFADFIGGVDTPSEDAPVGYEASGEQITFLNVNKELERDVRNEALSSVLALADGPRDGDTVTVLSAKRAIEGLRK